MLHDVAPGFTSYPALHVAQWSSTCLSATVTHVAQAEPVPVAHVYIALHDVALDFTSYPALHVAHWPSTSLSAAATHVAHAEPVPVVHV